MIPCAIFLCDKTGIAARPWADAGIECWCVDIDHSIRRDRREGNINFVWGDVRSWRPPTGRKIMPVEQCGAIAKMSSNAQQAASSMSAWGQRSKTAVATYALQRLETAMQSDRDIHEKNRAALEANKAVRERIVALMEEIGMPKTRRVRDGNRTRYGVPMTVRSVQSIVHRLPYRRAEMPPAVRQRFLDRLKANRLDRSHGQPGLPDAFFVLSDDDA